MPNALTLLRVLLVPVFFILIRREDYTAALAVFVVAGATDGLDGWIARRFDLSTPFGAFVDPIADKFMLVTAFLTLSLTAVAVPVPLPLAGLVVARDLAILGMSAFLFFARDRRDLRPSIYGKATTVVQLAFVTSVLFDNARGERGMAFHPLAALTVILTLVSSFHYFLAHRDARRGDRGADGGAA